MKLKYFFSVLMLSLFALSSFAQSDKGLPEGNFYLKGRVLNEENNEPVEGAHIFNTTKSFMAVSKTDGSFIVPAKGGDTLRVTVVGYNELKYAVPVNASSDKIYLVKIKPKVYELEEVVVNPFPSERDFKRKLLEADIPDDKPKVELAMGGYKVQPENRDGDVKVAKFEGPISSLADAISGRAKARERFERNKTEHERQAYIDTKYNKEVVMKVTGLEDGEKLDAFMGYCKLSDDFIYKASDYELYDAIISCYKEFDATYQG